MNEVEVNFMCLVRARLIGFFVTYSTLMLLYRRARVYWPLRPMSLSRKVIHVSSAIAKAIERYSASALDLATVDCFLEL